MLRSTYFQGNRAVRRRSGAASGPSVWGGLHSDYSQAAVHHLSIGHKVLLPWNLGIRHWERSMTRRKQSSFPVKGRSCAARKKAVSWFHTSKGWGANDCSTLYPTPYIMFILITRLTKTYPNQRKHHWKTHFAKWQCVWLKVSSFFSTLIIISSVTKVT
jgi:hypothetical protein